MSTDASLIVTDSMKKSDNYILVEQEEIVFKPSVALIPDVYDHKKKRMLIHIFRTDFDKVLDDDFNKTFKSSNYKIKYYDLNTTKQFTEDLNSIKKKSGNQEGLFIIFVGFFEIDGSLNMMEEDGYFKNIHIKTIWNWFTPINCPKLKYKPKVFLFCTTKKPSKLTLADIDDTKIDFDAAYDFPTESDLLIIYKKQNTHSLKSKQDFLIRFCANIRKYSKIYDVIDLITISQNQDDKAVPLIISTFTRKYYVMPNTCESFDDTGFDQHSDLELSLKTIKHNIEKLHNNKKKRKKFLNFRMKKMNTTEMKKEHTHSETLERNNLLEEMTSTFEKLSKFENDVNKLLNTEDNTDLNKKESNLFSNLKKRLSFRKKKKETFECCKEIKLTETPKNSETSACSSSTEENIISPENLSTIEQENKVEEQIKQKNIISQKQS